MWLRKFAFCIILRKCKALVADILASSRVGRHLFIVRDVWHPLVTQVVFGSGKQIYSEMLPLCTNLHVLVCLWAAVFLAYWPATICDWLRWGLAPFTVVCLHWRALCDLCLWIPILLIFSVPMLLLLGEKVNFLNSLVTRRQTVLLVVTSLWCFLWLPPPTPAHPQWNVHF